MEKILGFLGFLISWIMLNYVVSYFSGWNALGRSYHSSVRPEGEVFRFRSGFGHWWCLTFVVSPEGLYIEVIFPFNLAGADPVFIPLNDIFVQTNSLQGFGRTKVTFKNTGRSYDLPGDVVEAINKY